MLYYEVRSSSFRQTEALAVSCIRFHSIRQHTDQCHQPL